MKTESTTDHTHRPSADRSRSIRMKDVLPLIWYLLPTAIITYGVVIPRSAIAGVNEVTIGIGTTLLGAAVTYVIGIRTAKR